MKHIRTEEETDNEVQEDENRISNSIKRLRIDSGDELDFPGRLPTNRLLPEMSHDGDIDYCGTVSPLLKELAMLRNLRRIMRKNVDSSSESNIQGENQDQTEIQDSESVAMEEDEIGNMYTP